MTWACPGAVVAGAVPKMPPLVVRGLLSPVLRSLRNAPGFFTIEAALSATPVTVVLIKPGSLGTNAFTPGTTALTTDFTSLTTAGSSVTKRGSVFAAVTVAENPSATIPNPPVATNSTATVVAYPAVCEYLYSAGSP